MALTLRKRAVRPTPSAASTRRKTARQESSIPKAKDTPTKRKTTKKRKQCADLSARNPSRRKLRPHKDTISVPESLVEGIPAPPYRPVKNPQATLHGLPAELRLQIYSYLCTTTLIHVHRHEKLIRNTSTYKTHFTWTPCKGVNPNAPQLCANPKWSGLCAEEDRCTWKIRAPPEPRGFWGLAATCKSIRNEAQEFFMRNTVISIYAKDLYPWLCHVQRDTPRQFENIRKVTLNGGGNTDYHTIEAFSILADRIPHIEAVGYQGQEPRWRWQSVMQDLQPEEAAQERWKDWFMNPAIKPFSRSVSVAIEGYIWAKEHTIYEKSGGILTKKYCKEQQMIVRFIREGQEDPKNWWGEPVYWDIIRPRGVVEPKRNAKWKAWWRVKELKHFT